MVPKSGILKSVVESTADLPKGTVRQGGELDLYHGDDIPPFLNAIHHDNPLEASLGERNAQVANFRPIFRPSRQTTSQS